MKKNMGNLDRGLRIIAAIVITLLFYLGVLSGVLGTILLVLAVVFILTSFVSFCPLYYPFKISTKRADDKY